MKKSIYFFAIVISLIAINCSTTHYVSKNYSRTDLYNDFNKSCNDRRIKITLLNDSSFTAQYGAIVSNDSLLLYAEGHNTTNGYIPLDKVKEASYNKHWVGMTMGFFAGIIVGAISAVSQIIHITSVEGNDTTPSYDYINASIIEIPLGAVIGSVAGWFIGFDYIYKFN